jgi:SAM-dependent methyltransferase
MSELIVDAVRSRYGAVAKSGLSSEHEGVRAVAEAFGYTPEELASIPAGANMGLSCGNPTATAHLREGETVVDLGSGGGLDVFLAAAKVGPSGRAIGIDMTSEMIELARRNATKLEGGASNIEFHQASIDKLPLRDSTVDCVISNCVINLAPDKKAVFREIARVLKPGGRLAVSDIALKRTLPPEVSSDVLAYVGCIAGAISMEDYRQGLIEAGFSEVMIIDSGADLNAYTKVENQAGCCSPAVSEPARSEAQTLSAGCCSPVVGEPARSDIQTLPISSSNTCCGTGPEGDLHDSLKDLLARYNVNDYAASVKVFAVKPLSRGFSPRHP